MTIAVNSPIALVPMLLVAPALLSAHTARAPWVVIPTALVLAGFWWLTGFSIGIASSPGILLLWIASVVGALEGDRNVRIAVLAAMACVPFMFWGIARFASN